jgi:hypothetical protein
VGVEKCPHFQKDAANGEEGHSKCPHFNKGSAKDCPHLTAEGDLSHLKPKSNEMSVEERAKALEDGDMAACPYMSAVKAGSAPAMDPKVIFY